MLLAIDSGNTNIVFALFDGDERKGVWRTSIDRRRTADELAVWLGQLMSMHGLGADEVDAVVMANVVPAVDFTLRTFCRQYLSCDPLVIGDPGVELGIEALVDHPAEVGADRLANTVGAHTHYGGPFVVIDFGTTTNFDVGDADGNYRGGAIAPGIGFSLEALHTAAAQLPRIGVKRPEKVIGTSTVACMQSGIYWGYAGLIDGLLTRILAEFGSDMTVVATGGLAPLFDEAIDGIQHVDADITLRGLVEICRRNGQQ